MINRRLRNYLKTTPAQSLMPVRPALFQRKCACGAATNLSACSKCSSKGKGTSQLAPTQSSLAESSSPALSVDHAPDGVQRSAIQGHDFGHLRIYPEHHEAPDRSINVNGLSSIRLTADTLFIDGPDKDAPKTPPPQKTPPPKQKPPAAKADCPADIQVIQTDQLNDPDFGKPGAFQTGVGAIALMGVSGPGRKDWNGVKIQESLKQIKNTCGARAKDVCSNVSGEKVPFEVGKATKVFGTEQPAFMNAFQDQHIFARKDVSVLHEKGIPTCQVQCEQTYKCGGKQVGPTFIITYNATKDIAKSSDVTRITVEKSPKAAPAAPPPKP